MEAIYLYYLCLVCRSTLKKRSTTSNPELKCQESPDQRVGSGQTGFDDEYRHFLPKLDVQRGRCYEGLLAAFAHSGITTEELAYLKGILDMWHVGVMPNHHHEPHKGLAGLRLSCIVRKYHFQTLYLQTV